MISEILILSAAAAGYWNLDKIKIYSKWKKITDSKSEFTNKLGKTLKILKINRKEYGYIITTELPYGYTMEALKNDLDIFKEGLNIKSIQLESKNNIAYMHCVASYNFKEYNPIKFTS